MKIGKNLNRDLTESDGNFFATEYKCISKIRDWITQELVEGYKSLNMKPNKIFIKAHGFM